MDWKLDKGEDKVTVTVTCPKSDQGLYKAYAIGPSGKCLLGTLTPEAGGLRLQKTLSIDALKQRGCWPVHRVETQLAFQFQEDPLPKGWCRPLHISLKDEVLKAAAGHSGSPLYRPEAHGFTLAWPFSTAKPFPLTPLFCLAQITCLDHHLYALFSFDQDGTPLLPNSRP